MPYVLPGKDKLIDLNTYTYFHLAMLDLVQKAAENNFRMDGDIDLLCEEELESHYHRCGQMRSQRNFPNTRSKHVFARTPLENQKASIFGVRKRCFPLYLKRSPNFKTAKTSERLAISKTLVSIIVPNYAMSRNNCRRALLLP